MPRLLSVDEGGHRNQMATSKLFLGAGLSLFSLCALVPFQVLYQNVNSTLLIAVLLAKPLSWFLFEDDGDLTSISSLIIICTWASSVIYLLDWGAPWQRYPLPTLCGYGVGSVIALLVHIYNTQNRLPRKGKRQ